MEDARTVYRFGSVSIFNQRAEADFRSSGGIESFDVFNGVFPNFDRQAFTFRKSLDEIEKGVVPSVFQFHLFRYAFPLGPELITFLDTAVLKTNVVAQSFT